MAALLSIPAVFIGIHAGGHGGRIAWYLPDTTPCYRCIAPERFAAANGAENEVNLTAAHGSVIDTQFTTLYFAASFGKMDIWKHSRFLDGCGSDDTDR